MTLSTTEVHLGLIPMIHLESPLSTTEKEALGKEVEEESRTLLVHSHSLEAWTMAFPSSGDAVYSGGDDSGLLFRSLPTYLSSTETDSDTSTWAKLQETFAENADIEEVEEEPGLAWADKRIHGAGVTAILPLGIPSSAPFSTTDGNTSLITGSYDDTIRLISIAPSTRRTVLTSLNLGGGVWRLKLLSFSCSSSRTEFFFLVSCMHAGTRIVRLSHTKEGEEGEWAFDVLARFEEHKSMNYGSDSRRGLDGDGKRTVVSTSFYDRLVCLWRFEGA